VKKKKRWLERNELPKSSNTAWRSPHWQIASVNQNATDNETDIGDVYANARSMADDTVWSEPVSGSKFPVKQGKYREFPRFEPFFA
jgi:hypothetical protein